MKEYNICLSCDNNYAQYAGVVIASILLNSDDKSFFNFYILDGNIEQENKDKIEKLKEIKDFNLNFISIDENLFEVYKKIGTHSYISLSTYYRLKLASLLPDVDNILYLDCDVIINSNLAELLEIDISEYYAAGVKDIAVNSSGYVPKLEDGNLYFNAGVLYFNLDKIRKDNIESEFEKYTIENFDKIRVGDQEIINVVCQGKIKELPSVWNVQSSNFVNRSDYTKNPNIVHYVGRNKPWKFGSINYWKNLYFNVLEKTPWAIPSEEINKWTKENQKQSIINYLKYRPLFFLRPRFYKALIKTYL